MPGDPKQCREHAASCRGNQRATGKGPPNHSNTLSWLAAGAGEGPVPPSPAG
jgi:hypothetical protein